MGLLLPQGWNRPLFHSIFYRHDVTSRHLKHGDPGFFFFIFLFLLRVMGLGFSVAGGGAEWKFPGHQAVRMTAALWVINLFLPISNDVVCLGDEGEVVPLT